MPSSIRKSTIVRSFRASQLALIRAGLRSLDPIAPALAARWAMRRWCTPPTSPRHRRAATAPAGERFTTTLAADPVWATRPRWRLPRGRQFAVPAAARGMVVAESWGDGAHTTYLLHGWGGWRGQLSGLVEPLVAAGQRVVALDTLGHGESGSGRLGGRRTTLVEAGEALRAVAAVTGPAHAIIAHSAGCLAASLAVRGGLATDRLVFIAPMADPLPYTRQFARFIGLGPRSWQRFRQLFVALAGHEFAEFDLPAVAAAAQPSTLPRLLVIHDRADKEIRYTDGERLAAAWPGGQLLTTDGLGHRRILTAPALVEAAISFVTRPLADPDAREFTPATGRVTGG